MKGLIITNAYWRAACVTEQAERIKCELEAAGAEADVRCNGFFPCAVAGGIDAARVRGYDFCVYLDKDKYVSEMLERSGLRLFDSHAAVRLCDDKMRTYIALASAGIPVPRTLPAPLCYTPGAEVREDILDGAEAAFGYPMIVKTAYGSGGKGVYKADDRAELRHIASALLREPHLFQEYVRAGAGRDLRVIVVGGKALGGMLRRAPEGEFRSNIAAGGSGEPYSDGAAFALAERAAAAVGADYAGVDLLFTDGGYVVCEVNSNAFFAEFERVCGINVAGAYARHILGVMSGAGK